MTTESITLSFFLPTVDLTAFDVLEVHRSMLTEAGPYVALTADLQRGARVPDIAGVAPSPPITGPLLNATGTSLTLRINGVTDVTMTMTGVDPLTSSNIAAQITSQSFGMLSAFVLGSQIVIETVEVGNHMTLEVVAGELAGMLGLSLNQISYGLEAYLPLIFGVTDYVFTDQRGSASFFYKTRLRNRRNLTVSGFSEALQPSIGGAGADTVTGSVSLIDSTGIVLISREVHVFSRPDGRRINGYVVAGMSQRKLTDSTGTALFKLVRGLPITVVVAGTDLVRDLVVPTDPSVKSFNLFDESLGSDDLFKVQVPNVPYATRRSL